ncbi:MAG: hypothetical protein AB7E77_09355 [Desulfobulbus sp.]
MSEQSPLTSQSAKLKKAIVWMAEALYDTPEKARYLLVEEAQLRFDLTPRECEFLNKYFTAAEA